jgi:hypothetical protein
MNKVRKIFVAHSRRVGAGLHRQDARHGDAFSPRCTSSGTWTTEWLSVEAKDFLAKCMCSGVKAEDVVMAKWVSPKSTLDTALRESDGEDDLPESPADRIRSLAGP